MNEFFTVLLKENESTNIKLLTEKLNDGFHISDTITVGRSTVVTLRRNSRSNRLTESVAVGMSSSDLSYGSSETIPF